MNSIIYKILNLKVRLTMKSKMIPCFFFISIVALIFFGCHYEEHRYIYVQNNSNKTIYYGLSYSFPDTNLIKIEDVPGRDGNISHKINSNQQTTVMAAAFAFNSTMQMFIFDADIIEKNPWDSIVKYNLILKRYQYTESDMQKCDWIISYK